jgi:hypothetical protein
MSYIESSLAFQLESMGQSTGAIGFIFALQGIFWGLAALMTGPLSQVLET